MESFATDVAKSTLEKLVDATIVQSHYICCFNSIADDFEKEKEALRAKRKTVEAYVKVAKERDENIREDVTWWLKKADELIEEDTKTKVTCFFGWCPNYKWRYSRGKELAQNTEGIKRLIMESTCDSVGIPRSVADVEYHSSKDYISFKSRELKCKELLEALTDDNNCIIGLVGMGGAGKTTLAREVGNELQKSKKFDHVIFTVVSNTLDIKKIQDDIAAQLGLSLKDCTESERSRRLGSRLTNGEKILIILDDVWEYISFEDIGIPDRDNHNCRRILITSRNLRTCKLMKSDRIIELELLSEEDAWMLFKNHAGLSDRSSKSILDKGRKIAKKCKRLPIAIAVVASSLKGDEQRQEEWDVALKSLQRPNPMHGDDENVREIYKCLRYSYDNMRDKRAKELFLLCSMFREDEEIDDETLTTLSIAVRLVGEIDGSYDESRSQVVVTKNKLIDSCLLLKIDERTVKMHDIVREVALLIANEEVKAVNTCIEKQKSWVEKAKNLKYLLCEGKGTDVFSLGFDKSKLEILFVHINGDENDSLEIPDSFFQNMIRLRVLYLSDETSRGWRTLSLSQSIQSLTNIRSLYLTMFTLGDISILRHLQGLETLDLDVCSMDELPREIAGLEKLKLLRLFRCEIKRNNPFKVIESCSSLEELYFIYSFPEDMSTMHQKVELPKLRRFQIEVLYYSGEEKNCLNVSKADGVFSEATFKHLMQTSNSIHLLGLEGGWRNLTPDIILPEDEGALNLTRLDLKCISEVECLIDAKHIGSRIQNVFSNLARLKLEQMANLKELWSVPLTLSNLTVMALSDCPMLVTLFPLSTIQSLVLLQHLYIENCEQLESIMTDEKEKEDSQEEEIVEGNNDNKSGASLFPNLKTLWFERCPKLEFVLPGVAGRDFPKLEIIQIRDCVELKYVFGPYQHQQEKDLHRELENVIFATLKEMVLQGLPNFVSIFWKYDQYRSSSVKRSCSKEESKTEIESSVKRSCSKDGFKCNIFPWSSKYRHKLRTAKLPLDSDAQDCTLSSNIDRDTMNHGMSFLPRLQVLVIKQCNNIKCVFPFPTSKMPPKLEVLAIIEASMLEEVFRWESDKKVEISDAKVAIFVELPSFSQGIEWSKTYLVQNCPKLPLNSTSTLEKIQEVCSSAIKDTDFYFRRYIIKEIVEKTLDNLRKEAQETSNQNPTTKATEDFSTKTKVQASSENELTSSQVKTSQSIHSNKAEDNQHVNGIDSNEFISTEKQNKETLEIEQECDEKLPGLEMQSIPTSPTNSKLIGKSGQSPSRLDIPLNESHLLEDQNSQEQSMSEKTPKTTFSTHPKMGKISSRPLVSPSQKGVKRSVEEGTTSINDNTIASPIDLGLNSEGQIAKPSLSIVNMEPATIKGFHDGDVQETSKSIITHIMTNAPENLSQISKDSNFTSIVRRELEQLVLNKHLAFENLELLINFLVNKPSVHLTNSALSDRYKGFAYNCLVELLIFLQTHSVLDVLESNHSEFVGLLQDVRRFGFDKNWLDDVERRAFFPCLPSSENALKNLLDSKHTLIQHLEDLKHQLEESINQQVTRVLEIKDTFRTPLGF